MMFNDACPPHGEITLLGNLRWVRGSDLSLIQIIGFIGYEKLSNQNKSNYLLSLFYGA
jgi:hypothetical protein